MRSRPGRWKRLVSMTLPITQRHYRCNRKSRRYRGGQLKRPQGAKKQQVSEDGLGSDRVLEQRERDHVSEKNTGMLLTKKPSTSVRSGDGEKSTSSRLAFRRSRDAESEGSAKRRAETEGHRKGGAQRTVGIKTFLPGRRARTAYNLGYRHKHVEVKEREAGGR